MNMTMMMMTTRVKRIARAMTSDGIDNHRRRDKIRRRDEDARSSDRHLHGCLGHWSGWSGREDSHEWEEKVIGHQRLALLLDLPTKM